MPQQIEETQTGTEPVALWRGILEPYCHRSCWLRRGIVLLHSDPEARLRCTLTRPVGQARTFLLPAGLAGSAGDLASLGPLPGLSQVARTAPHREAYLERCGHRSRHESELSQPRPDGDPTWLDWQSAEFDRAPGDVDTLLSGQHNELEGARARLRAQHPRQVPCMWRRAEHVASTGLMAAAVMRAMWRSALALDRRIDEGPRLARNIAAGLRACDSDVARAGIDPAGLRPQCLMIEQEQPTDCGAAVPPD